MWLLSMDLVLIKWHFMHSGKLWRVRIGRKCDSSFSSSASKESILSSSASISGNDVESYSSSYFDLDLGDKGLRIGHWNVDYRLTAAKFEQIKLHLPGNFCHGKPQLDVFLSETDDTEDTDEGTQPSWMTKAAPQQGSLTNKGC